MKLTKRFLSKVNALNDLQNKMRVLYFNTHARIPQKYHGHASPFEVSTRLESHLYKWQELMDMLRGQYKNQWEIYCKENGLCSDYGLDDMLA